MAHSVSKAFLAVFALGFLAMGACTEDTIVSESRDPFNPPADSVNLFLGYTDVEAGWPTCGNCHADQTADWKGTHHSEAWESLQASGHALQFCEGCHAVSENGNALTAPAGINALDSTDTVGRATYFDVQCENCHGPGADHAANPSVTQPLASIDVGVGLGNGCGDCHTGVHTPFVEQWSQSAHGNVTSFASGRSTCGECHNGRLALLAQFGENANYVEKTDTGPFDIVCATCHDPHSHDNDAQLRAPLNLGSNRNLCIKCHNRLTVPTATTHGPHAAQGPLVLAENIGWWPDSLDWQDGLTATHGDESVNERLCATCHVEFFEVTDAATGDFVFQSVGHLFEAIPCLDAQGIPVAGGGCAVTERRFTACLPCHITEGIARTAYLNFKAELTGYLEMVWNDANANDTLDTGDTGLLVSIVAQEGGSILDVSDVLFTTAEGVLWNAQLAATDDAPWFADFYIRVNPANVVHISSHPTSGNGVHNPKFLRALMIASINEGAAHYGVPNPLPAVQQGVLPEGVVRK
jgi:predicted CXXCH cytochrome family protein